VGPRRRRQRRGGLTVRAASAAALAALAAAVPWLAAPAARGAPAGGAEVVASRQVDARLLELTVRTPALRAATRVRVLLPTGYDRSPRRRYPVLYLLHGAGDDYRGWTRSGQVERTTAGKPLVVVMPDGGLGGWYTDWHNDGKGGPPEWETYHVEQLVRLVDHRFRTVAARRGRAIAGLSMGGFGAFSYAARHPDLYAAAASFSGGVDLNQRLYGAPAGEVAVEATEIRDGGHPGSAFGDFTTDNIRWRGHNPPDLAVNLRGLALGLYTGDGQPGGPLGGGAPDIIELGAHDMSAHVHARLRALGIPHVWDDYGPGSHTWPYWARDLRRALPWMLRRFAHPAASPARVTYTSTERAYRVYGWRVALRRPNVEFSTLRGAGRRGFTLTGSGLATVATPARYRPSGVYRVRVSGAGATTTRTRVADRAGRLRIGVALGPVNRFDEDSPRAVAAGAPHRATATVRIAPARAR
jgi:S-formylglutathione hydrolase FrmB